MTEATEGLLLVQIPSVVGVTEVVLPIHNVFRPTKLATGLSKMIIGEVGFEIQFVDDDVKVKLADPAANPVTKPALVTAATFGFELVQVPPVDGLKVVVEPTQIVDKPVMPTTGIELIVIGKVGLERHSVELLLNVKVA